MNEPVALRAATLLSNAYQAMINELRACGFVVLPHEPVKRVRPWPQSTWQAAGARCPGPTIDDHA